MKTQQKLLLSILLFIAPRFAICQQKTWTIQDRAALVGFLANPGFKLHFHSPNESKMIAWNFYFEKPYYAMGDAELKKRQTIFFNLVYRYVLQKPNLRLYDTLAIKSFTLNNEVKNVFISKIDGVPELSEPILARLATIKKLLVFPCEIDYGGDDDCKYLIFHLNKDKCPKTAAQYSLNDYATSLSWFIKDYALKDVKDYKTAYILFENSKGETVDARVYNFTEDCFNHIYDHSLYHQIKNK